MFVPKMASVFAAVCLFPAVASASFHVMHVESVMNRFASSEAVEYVELELGAGGQTKVQNTRLSFFNSDGSVVTVLDVADQNVSNGSSGASILFATAAFGTATGLIPDFFFAAGTIEDSGMICWGAPGASSAPDPDSWDETVPNNYVDCVAFGDYSGPLPSGKTGVSSDPPSDGRNALNRVADTHDDAVDFELGPPRPCNNAGNCAVLTAPTTTTSTMLPPTSSSTTSTLPEPTDCCGDVDGSGSVSASDALAVLRKAVGLDVAFQCEQVCFPPGL